MGVRSGCVQRHFSKKNQVNKMFGKMFEMGSLLQQAKQFSGKILEMNEQMNVKLKQLRVTGSAAGGMVTVEMNGVPEMLTCHIDPAMFQQDNAELLEELVVAATNQAIEHAIEESQRLRVANMAFNYTE